MKGPRLDTTPGFEHWRPGTRPEVLSEALFEGVPVLFDALPPVRQLIARARSILEQVFETDDPEGAETSLSAPRFRRMAMQARKIVADDGDVARHWADTLALIGYAPAATWFDRIRLRVVPSRADIDHPRLQTLPPHRDTWASGIMAQVNWWLPLYPLSASRTMLLWPRAYRRAIANDSSNWSFEAFKSAGRHSAGRDSYPLLPTARTAPAERGLPVLIEPGQILGFSAAHLHAGTSDASGRTRFSVDSRTVWDPDRRAGHGAPNMDCGARTEMWQWYRPPVETEGSP